MASLLGLAKGSWLAAYLVLVAGVPVYLVGRFIARWLLNAGLVILIVSITIGLVLAHLRA